LHNNYLELRSFCTKQVN